MSFNIASPASDISIAAAGLSSAASIFGGFTNAANQEAQGQATNFADDYQAGNLDLQATFGDIKASQTDVYLRQKLQTTLSNVNAVRASANVGAGSPTQSAIENRGEAQSDTARTTQLQNIYQQSALDRSQASFARASGEIALQQSQQNASNGILGGILGGVASLAKGLGPLLAV